MITKILFTALLILGLVYYLRFKGESRPQRSPRSTTRQQAPAPTKPLIPRSVLYLFIGAMLLATAIAVYFDWEKSHRIVTIRVINADTGQVTEYQARRSDIEGRQFQTLDGRLITLAGVERMELELSGDTQ